MDTLILSFILMLPLVFVLFFAAFLLGTVLIAMTSKALEERPNITITIVVSVSIVLFIIGYSINQTRLTSRTMEAGPAPTTVELESN